MNKVVQLVPNSKNYVADFFLINVN